MIFNINYMEIIIAILLGVIAMLLNRSINEQVKTRTLLEKIWSGLFNIPNSGLPMLSYLEYIHNEIKKIKKYDDK